jgi:hypothetical protein
LSRTSRTTDDAQTAVERELVLRLASLLWRLRRATAIETDLLRIQAEILCHRRDRTPSGGQPEQPHAMPFRVIGRGMLLRDDSRNDDSDPRTAEHQAASSFPAEPSRDIAPRDLAHCFQRLANFDNGLFERLGRYETALWRQMVQTLFVLEPVRRH